MGTPQRRGLLGVDPRRQPPPPRARTAVDYDRWHTAWVVWETCEYQARADAAVGELELPAPCKRIGRRWGSRVQAGEAVRTDEIRDPDPDVEKGRRLLVAARYCTVAAAERLTAAEVRICLEDLERRIRIRQALGIDGPSRAD